MRRLQTPSVIDEAGSAALAISWTFSPSRTRPPARVRPPASTDAALRLQTASVPPDIASIATASAHHSRAGLTKEHPVDLQAAQMSLPSASRSPRRCRHGSQRGSTVVDFEDGLSDPALIQLEEATTTASTMRVEARATNLYDRGTGEPSRQRAARSHDGGPEGSRPSHSLKRRGGRFIASSLNPHFNDELRRIAQAHDIDRTSIRAGCAA